MRFPKGMYTQAQGRTQITNSEEAVLDCEGIRVEVIPIWKWLLMNDL